MKWEILLLTQPSRKQFLAQLLSVLEQQLNFNIGLQFRMFDSGMSLGENREIMRLNSVGDYISFFDDDDLPSPDFVSSIFPLL